jgi:uncharacterized protein
MQPALSNPAPVATVSSKRILLVDVLRAVALFGIIINHITLSYLAGPSPAGNEQFNIFSPLDSALNTGSFVLTFGKFFTIFSFLFGLSFAIQLGNAQRKGTAFTGRFIWRLAILFAIGYVHNLFYSGDILIVYAVLGLLLLPARYLSNKVLLPLALLLILNVPGLVQDIVHVNAPPPTEAQIAAQAEAGKGFAKMSQEQYRIKQSGSLQEVIQMNASSGLFMKFFFQVFTGRLWITLGLFLLGMYAGRKKAFEYSASNARFFKKLLVISGVIALVSTVLALLYGSPFGRAATPIGVLGNFSFSIHQAALSTFYVAGITLLYWQTSARVKLDYLAPVGQMGLTTYLMQSVFGLLVYFGFGLGMMGKIGVTGSIGLGVAFFAVQILFANWWMAHYRYGMVEWLWRSLTCFEMQPLRRSTERNETEPAPEASVVPKLAR